MEAFSIIFLLLISAVFAVYPDMKKQINIPKLFMAIISFLVEESKTHFNNSESSNEEENASTNPPVPYEKKYIEKFRNLDEVDVYPESIKNTFVVDYTPYGNVVMMYSEDKETFVYWTDNTMPYRFLEAVAQKFAIVNNAKKLVVDTEQEIEKLKKENEVSETEKNENEIENKKTEKTEKTESEKKSVFAKFKSYNQMTTPGVGANVREVPSTTKSQDPELLLEKTNTFTCEGKISNMNILQQTKPDSHDTRRKMTFADFKKLTSN
tara:strand:- start:44 stop:841 length:798 start_codon:yes stop_codon:yes gene_type:complete